ncbi:MAG: methylated-DNA--[protein]-cysteine S-methyltransferase [Deltaproteobacteria bacterium]|nr:MAG: methylated-DNA--[protein]-cysteine S-methyltransferase [Deltaproteobacteria bacterium]
MDLYASTVATSLGPVWYAVRDGALAALYFADRTDRAAAHLARWYPGVAVVDRRTGAVERALAAYFAGDVGALAAVDAAPRGTPFQLAVWHALRAIPPGATWTYAQLAARVGRPRAARAVGAANGANPVSLVLPCHRVIGASGRLTGYGGGIDRKRWLLVHEGALPA